MRLATVAVLTPIGSVALSVAEVRAEDVVCAYGSGEGDGTGYETPEQAVKAVSGLEVVDAPASGTLVEGDDSYTITPQPDGGYLVTSSVECFSLPELAVADVALAHNAGSHYLGTYPGNPATPTFHFTQEVAGPVKRDSIRFGGNQWDQAGGASFRVDFGSDNGNYSGWDRKDCNPLPNDDIHWDNSLPSQYVGYGYYCTDAQGKILGAAVIFDEGRTWNLEDDNPASNEFDVRGVATHEFGHAFGFDGHWDEGAALRPNDSDRHTMCPTAVLGEKWYRSLEEHDKHTFDDAY